MPTRSVSNNKRASASEPKRASGSIKKERVVFFRAGSGFYLIMTFAKLNFKFFGLPLSIYSSIKSILFLLQYRFYHKPWQGEI